MSGAPSPVIQVGDHGEPRFMIAIDSNANGMRKDGDILESICNRNLPSNFKT